MADCFGQSRNFFGSLDELEVSRCFGNFGSLQEKSQPHFSSLELVGHFADTRTMLFKVLLERKVLGFGRDSNYRLMCSESLSQIDDRVQALALFGVIGVSSTKVNRQVERT